MAIYIPIRKTDETESFVEYSFSSNDRTAGMLRIDKESGNVELIDQAEGDDDLRFFSCAAHVVKRNWRAGRYPDSTCWAS